eukprot:5791151-Lingulodinium_polyedra.AAC.1
MKVAEKYLSNLQGVFKVAKDLSEKKNKSEDSEDSDQSAADVFANRKDLGPQKQKKGPATWDVAIPHEDDQRGDRGLSNEASPANYKRTEKNRDQTVGIP